MAVTISESINFSVALPIGCWHPLLPKMLSSIKFQNVELEIALMDSSGDPRVAHTISESGLDFAYHHEGPDKGQADAIATGWAKTRGDVVFWLNADDQLMPEALNVAAAAFNADRDLAVFYGGSKFVDIDGIVTGHHDQVADASDLIYRSNIVSQPSCFVRRNWVDLVGGLNRSLHYTMDWDLWVRLYAAGAPFQRTPAMLSQVYMGEGTKTSKINFGRLNEIARLVNRYAGPINALKSVMAVAQRPLLNAY
ncbi:glycosyltransferase [Hyphobacterium sp. HN65]|uniref:Glycosyltransferase n=1 Tax=Hyphobacterium lacteum TaxID=3116575 RepID=A0ABU7LPN3_9PROT|nr:glycosyltransferase [Hyphobacterium sp. HN65]MEE2525876.1 glycosyltransferase [Hyphobacterium sp. HN65]